MQAEGDQAAPPRRDAREQPCRSAPARARRGALSRAASTTGIRTAPEALIAAAVTNATPAPICRRRERPQPSAHARARCARQPGPQAGRTSWIHRRLLIVPPPTRRRAAAGRSRARCRRPSGSRCGRRPAPTPARSGSARRARSPRPGRDPAARAHFHTRKIVARLASAEDRLDRPERRGHAERDERERHQREQRAVRAQQLVPVATGSSSGRRAARGSGSSCTG